MTNEKSLLKSFDSQRKRNIKKAQKYGVKVRFLEVDEIDIFMDLYLDTSERQGFFTHPNPKEYFTNFKKSYGDKVLIPLAKEGNILNLASGIYFETPYEMVYNSGASSSKYAQFVGPYMMHFEMMNYCMDKGISRYNFYGVSGDFSTAHYLHDL